MNQSRLESLAESAVNTTIGYVIAIFTQLLIFPWFDIEVTMGQNFGIAAIFTLISLLRGYAVRRLFNAGIKRLAKKLAMKIKSLMAA